MTKTMADDTGNGDGLKVLQEKDRRRLREFLEKGGDPERFKDYLPKRETMVIPIKLSRKRGCKVLLIAPALTGSWLAYFRAMSMRIEGGGYLPAGPIERVIELPLNHTLVLIGEHVHDIEIEVAECSTAKLYEKNKAAVL